MIVWLALLAGCVGAWDADGDGLLVGVDCDDEDPEIGAPTEWWPDRDGDFYGDPQDAVLACEKPDGWLDRAGDCDDSDPDTRPNTPEVCDLRDNNCNGEIDDRPIDPTVWYPDLDQDGYGDRQGAIEQCAQPALHITEPGDCDDHDPLVNPEGEEVFYDGVDQDCDGGSDFDADGDGFDGVEFGGADCDDDQASTAPGAQELCDDGVDQDCDGADFSPCTLDGTVPLVRTAGVVLGPAFTGTGLGAAVLGDTDGDGVTDLAVGAPHDATIIFDAGSLAVVSGTLRGQFDLPDDGVFIAEDDPNAQWGARITAVGDLNGDGLADLAASAPGTGDGLDQRGEVRLLLAPFTKESLAVPFGVIVAEDRDDRAGQGLARGDLDGNGQAELLVGASYAGPEESGAVYVAPLGQPGVVALGAGPRWLGGSRGDEAGAVVAIVGDTDGDGLDDALIGAPGAADASGGPSAGRVYLVRGPPPPALALDADADARIDGPRGADDDDFLGPIAGGRFGESVADGGDLDGDGLHDLVVGAPDSSEQRRLGGGAWVFTGAPAGEMTVADAAVTFLPHHELDRLGAAVVGAGDMDGDGADDLAIGAPGAHDGTNNRSGRTYVFYGPLDRDAYTWEAYTALAGARPGDNAGSAVFAFGDLDGDGRAELGVQSGDALYLIYGAALDLP